MSVLLKLYENPPRQGPGDRKTLDIALRCLGVGRNQRILDAGCGTGADIDGLLAWAPDGHVVAIDANAPLQARVETGYLQIVATPT